MKFLAPILAALMLTGIAVQAADDPYADAVEIRHGLMMQMANDLGKVGAMVKGDAPFDAAIAAKATANVAAVASVISLEQFPAGSENGASADSFAKVELWANTDDFLAKLADLNTAAGSLQTAAVDLDSLKAAMAGVGKACAACHSSYRIKE